MKLRERICSWTTLVLAATLFLNSLVFALPETSAKVISRQPVAKQTPELTPDNLAKSPVGFEENRGQFDKRVRFQSRNAAGYTMFLTATEAVYVMPMSELRRGDSDTNSSFENKVAASPLQPETTTQAFALRMKIEGANPDSDFRGETELTGRTNYFRGSDKSKWQRDVTSYESVRYENVYNGIGMVWRGQENGAVRYDFLVEPNADASQIALEFDGADNIKIDKEGNLLIHTPAGTIKQNKPFSFQETDGIKHEIESRFIIEQSENQKSKIKFALGVYDRSKTLTIDPLTYSTYLGGATHEDYGRDVAVDAAGNVYVAGFTGATDFPTSSGVFDTTQNGNWDIFVTKLNATGTAMIYSTYIGGSAAEFSYAIAVDASGNAFVGGTTESGDYPTTAGAFDTSYNGNGDGFVTKLDANGAALSYSTYVGGSFFETGTSLAIDSSGNAYLVGHTFFSFDFPITPGAYTTPISGTDVFVTKLDPTGASLVYSTKFGGGSADYCQAIAVDSSDNVYLTGSTDSGDYPTTAGAFDSTHNGSVDVFVTKLNPSGTALVFSTFIGSTENEGGSALAVDSSGNVFITGTAFYFNPSNFPTTAGAYDTTYNGSDDVFVIMLDPSGSSLVYSTFIGANGSDIGKAITLDSSGNAVVYGDTGSGTYPTTAGAFSTTHSGGFDIFITRLNASGSALTYSTFLGGFFIERGDGGIAIDGSNNVFVSGFTESADYPTTAGAFDTTQNSGRDAFVTKLALSAPTAAEVSLSGRVMTADGRGLQNAIVLLTDETGNTRTTLTSSLGYYNFD